MAASDARPFPIKNTAYRVYFPIYDADGDLITGAAGLDSEISKDGGAFADCTNEATEIATSSGMYYLDITSTEANADAVCIIVKTSTSGAKTTPIVLYPVEGGDIDVDVTYINGSALSTSTAQLGVNLVNIAGAAVSTSTAQLGVNAVQAGGTAWGSGAITAAAVATGAIDADAIADNAIDAGAIATGALTSAKFAAGAINAAAIASDAFTAAKFASDVTAELQSGLATAAALTTLSGLVDDLEGRLTATRAGYLDNLNSGGVPLTAAAVDAILDEVVEGTLTLRQIMRILLAVLAGESTGGGTSTITFRDNADTKARVTATIDGSRNRTAITLDGA